MKNHTVQQLCVYADQEESFTQIGHVKTSQGQHTFLLTCLARGIPVYSISLRTKISPYHIQIWTKNLLFVSPPASFSWYLIPCGSKWSKDVWVWSKKCHKTVRLWDETFGKTRCSRRHSRWYAVHSQDQLLFPTATPDLAGRTSFMDSQYRVYRLIIRKWKLRSLLLIPKLPRHK